MNDFKINDAHWVLDLFLTCGKIISIDEHGYGIINNPDASRKRSLFKKTKEECINDMIAQLENLRDLPSLY